MNFSFPSDDALKELLMNADVLNADETGVRVKGRLHRLHVASTEGLTTA